MSSATAQHPLPDPTYSVVMESGDTLVSGDAARKLLRELKKSQGGAPSKFESCDAPCSVGQPVNTATGVFWHTFSDVVVPGRGPGLELSRTYSSAAASEAGMFGFGWSSNLETRLETVTDTASGVTTVTVVDGNNSRVTFTKNDSGYWAPPRVHAELDAGPGGTFILTDTRDRTTYTFDAAGVLQEVTDRNGESTTLGYANGRLATVTDSAGRALSFTWTGVGTGARVSSVVGPLGRTWTYTYHPDGTLASVKDPLNRSTSFTYDGSSHLLRTMTFPRGGTVSTDYDTERRVSKQTDTDGLVTSFAYENAPASEDDPAFKDGLTTTVTGPYTKTEYVYQSMTPVRVTTDVGTSQAATTRWEYDPNLFKVVKETDPLGKVRTFEYDAYGNVTRTTEPPVDGAPGKTWTAAFNADGTIASATLPTGKTTSWVYDARGNPTTVTDAAGNATTYTYGDPVHPGDVTRVTDAEGRRTDVTYDAHGNTATTSVYPNGQQNLTAQAGYNAAGEQVCGVAPGRYASGTRCPASFTAPPANVSSMVVDAAGQPRSVTGADGRTTTYDYDVDGNLTRRAGPGSTATGGVDTATYDVSGRVLSSVSAQDTTEKLTTGYGYDIGYGTAPCTASALTGVAKYCDTTTDAAGKVTIRYFTGLGRMVGLSEPGGRLTRSTHRLDGRVEKVTRPDGKFTTVGYFDDGRLKSVTHSTGVPGPTSYTYHPDGARASMTDPTGTTTYTYSDVGDLTQVVAGARTVGYARDKTGLATGITYPSGRVVTRGFDGAGRMTSVNDGSAGGGRTTTFGYDTAGNQTTTGLPGGATMRNTFDTLDRFAGTKITTPGGTDTAALSWTRNDYDQVAGETGTGATAPGSGVAYGYSATHRVKNAGTQVFGHDAVANPTTLGDLTQTFDASGNGQLTRS
ncbi:MAG: DUF6531 domain-containing protein, partial [Dermatophilaceae bacterium]